MSAQPRPLHPDGRVVIQMTTKLAEVVDTAIAHLARTRDTYQRDGRLAHVVRAVEVEEAAAFVDGTPQIRLMAAATLRERLTIVARFQRFDRRSEKWVDALPSDDVVGAILARGEYPGVPPLVGIIEAPSVRPDGSVIQQPGYDRATGFLYIPSGDFPEVPDRPTQEDARAALSVLVEPFAEFPYASPEHQAAALAGVLTVLGRPCIAGSIPALVHDKNIRGCGGTLNADAVSTIATGRPTAKMQYPADDGELEKVLGAYAIRGANIINFDNVNRVFGGGPLDRCLTAGDRVELRVLGKSEIPSHRWLALIMATANNVMLGGDTSRRTIISRLESPLENPEERQRYTHHPLLDWVIANRPRLVVAALTILRAWFVAGRPRGGCISWGSFESWSAIVPPAIVFAGGADPMLTRPAATGEEDAEKNALVAILEGLARLDARGAGLTARDIVAALYPKERLRGEAAPDGYEALREAIDGLTANPAGKAPSSQALGNKLRRFRRRVVGGRMLDCLVDTHTKVGVWRVTKLAGTAGAAGTDPSRHARDGSAIPTGMSENPTRKPPQPPQGGQP